MLASEAIREQHRSRRPLLDLAPARHDRRPSRHERSTTAPRLLAPLRPPRVLHYCGHMFGADGADEARIRAAVDAVLDEEEVGFAYGALACGGDIIAAEALLARGVELNVVMPFEEQDFLAQSVRPGGPGWEARYRACLRRREARHPRQPDGLFRQSRPIWLCQPHGDGPRRACAPSISPPSRSSSPSGTGWRRTGPAGTGADVARLAGGRRADADRRSRAGRRAASTGRRRGSSPRPSARWRRSCSPISRASRSSARRCCPLSGTG